MRNWMGAEISVDDLVYRGARDGNTSSFKVGKVVRLNEEKETARVEWLFKQSLFWEPNLGSGRRYISAPQTINFSVGTCSIDTLIPIEKSALNLLERKALFAQKVQNGEMTIDEYNSYFR